MIETLSKAKTLKLVKNVVTLFKVPYVYSFNAINFESDRVFILEELSKKFQSTLIAIRSSAADEDGTLSTSAGEYDSVLNIPSNNTDKIIVAINTVIASYEKKRPLLPTDEVIIQEMVKNISMSGVIFTHDLNTGAPYYVINYDDQSGSTDTVTSGNSKYANRTLYVHRNSINKLCSDRFKKILLAVQELEKVMNNQFLDIEFALGHDLTPYLLQVRAITTHTNWNRSISKKINTTLNGVHLFVKEKFKKIDGVYGETTVLGQMPDWNPVEMIGRAPRALSASLYQILITDKSWSKARAVMGYSIPNGQPLMVMLAGQPFINVRLSFHSYMPKDLSPEIAEKLVNLWVDRLKNSPEFHDKVEFEVAITTYSFDFDEKIKQLVGNILTEDEKKEFKSLHLKQSIRLVTGETAGSIDCALDKINLLNEKNKQKQSYLNFPCIYSMVEDCIELGTIPFSILARHGFIAKTILSSLVRIGIIDSSDAEQIQESVYTIASSLVDDMHSLRVGKMHNSDFMEKYGHLRPGTYDIMSQRYDQMENLIGESSFSYSEQSVKLFKFSKEQHQKISRLLIRDGFVNFNADDLLNYIQEAIVGREYAKFIFTSSVSDIIELIATFAKKHGLSREEISHIPIDSLLSMEKNSVSGTTEDWLRDISIKESKNHEISTAIRLPQLLVDVDGVYVIPFQVSHPNFITHKKVTASCVILNEEINKISLNGKIVLIKGADPGYDWIFSQKIAGLITKYGGVNSHMAIRCAEFGIPAAIGCGEQRFEKLITKSKVHLDCASGLINSLH